MNEDLAEEFGMQSEMANCYEEAQQERARRDQTQLAAYWTGQGKFVVCARVTYYCKSTDALVGDYVLIRLICDDLASAERAAASHPANFQNEDYGWFVYERPTVKPPEMRSERDDCPF